MLSKIYIDNALVRAKSHLMKGEAFEAQKIYQAILQDYSHQAKKLQQSLQPLTNLKQNNTPSTSTQKLKKINLFYEDDYLKISYCIGAYSNRCLIAFTGVGNNLGGIDVQSEEFFSQTKFGMVVWVTDKYRSWGNSLNVDKISKSIKNLVGEKDIYITGNSMGGFLGILFSSTLRAKSVIAFIPQFSVSPDVVPTETRWMNYRKDIKKFLYQDLSNSFNSNIKYAILLGSGNAEEIHYKKFSEFSKKSNLRIYKFLDAHHNVARYLKDLTLLNECINTFINGGSLENFFVRNSIKITN